MGDRGRVTAQRRQQRLAAASILGPHAPDVRRQQALAHELGQHGLGQGRTAAVHQGARPHEGGDQRRRHHGKPQADRRGQRLAERAAIDHPPGTIERCQRRQRPALPAELRVAVVLQHPGVGARRPVEQRQSPADRQCAAQRRGVRRGDQRQSCRGGEVDAGGDVEAFVVARHRDRDRAGGEQRATAGDVAGILDPDGVAEVQQQVGGKAQRLLRAAGHHDAVGVGQQAARRGQGARRSAGAVRAGPAAVGSRPGRAASGAARGRCSAARPGRETCHAPARRRRAATRPEASALAAPCRPVGRTRLVAAPATRCSHARGLLPAGHRGPTGRWRRRAEPRRASAPRPADPARHRCRCRCGRGRSPRRPGAHRRAPRSGERPRSPPP